MAVSTRPEGRQSGRFATLMPRRVDKERVADEGARGTRWPISLLWPDDEPGQIASKLNIFAINDLALDRIVRALDIKGGHESFVRNVLTQLCADPEVISYRQEVLSDLLDDPELTTSLQALLPELAGLGRSSAASWPNESPILPVMLRLGELDSYVECIDKLHAILQGAHNLRSAGFIKLREAVEALANDPEVVSLRKQLPELHHLISETNSVTIGMNLGPDLQPESATIVELNRFQYTGPRSLLGRLLGTQDEDARPGKTPIEKLKPSTFNKNSQLFKDLKQLLESVAAPLNRALGRYRDINASKLAEIEGELAFLTGAAQLFGKLRDAGLPICKPHIHPTSDKRFSVKESANLTLALQLIQESGAKSDACRSLVTNDICFDPNTTVLVVTGPNRGGKTTYCRAVGQTQVLFQCGLYVPGTRAEMSPVDALWTHFPVKEEDQAGVGRLDEEVQRMRDIFAHATGDSLILMNEPLTSTSERDAMELATGVVQGLQLLGAHSVMVTHLHELALSIPKLNESVTSGCCIRSLIAETTERGENVYSTFHIVPGVPEGQSHAMEIAKQHGLTYEQIEDLLKQRNVG